MCFEFEKEDDDVERVESHELTKMYERKKEEKRIIIIGVGGH